MQLPFEFDSALLSEEAKLELNKIGELMEEKNSEIDRLRIEGHTDSIGSSEYNQRLSERRAQSVKDYLVDNFNISKRSLKTKGKGENDPLDRDDPTAAENRRVGFLNIGR